ncbi:ras-related protein Rab-24-like [Babylonia areolata]|uniref:ras-related protein Rab-24-like n=1 Tax=Babylonia areolata TaxID=304850 RepID=UPI003FD0D62F
MAGAKIDAKVVLLGSSYVGKTCVVQRYLKNQFTGDTVPYQNTIGAAYGAKSLTINGSTVILGIWDTAGSERYEAMSRIYYRGAKAAILCFDLTDKSSFDRIRFWIGELRQHEENCRIYICATKYDLVEEHPELRAVSKSAAKSLAVDCLADLYETSSKTGKDIERLFTQIAEDYVKARAETLEKEKDCIKLGETPGRKSRCPCR